MKFDFSGLARPSSKPVGQGGTGGTSSNGKASSRPTMNENRWDAVGRTTGEQIGQAESSHLSHLHKNTVGHGKPLPIKAVPLVPPVPPKKHIAEDFRDAFEERSAIREFDGGLDRAEAERAAEDDLLITVNVRGLGRAEVRIPKTRADALAMLETIEQFTDKATLQ